MAEFSEFLQEEVRIVLKKYRSIFLSCFRPMSLSTIFNKVAGSDYTVSTLRDDMELIRQNAHTFCKDSFPAIVARADQLIELFTAELEMVSYAITRTSNLWRIRS